MSSARCCLARRERLADHVGHRAVGVGDRRQDRSADRIAVADHVTDHRYRSRMSGKIANVRSRRTPHRGGSPRVVIPIERFENSSQRPAHVSSRDADRHGRVVTSGGLGLAPLALFVGLRSSSPSGPSSASFAFCELLGIRLLDGLFNPSS